ncbi:MAG TPA: L-threonylcarbamoyladenylate synthase [Abditibacterium sp.]|jgi:L-threonylcarbamoyladenylate synthase
MPIFPCDDAHIERAARRLRGGDLVAFPTETVYGLGANALDPAAVAKIYAAKGRPSYNPLIVHVAEATQAQELVSGWNERAEKLAQAFWPGPLTLVLPKSHLIPDLVSAGLATVAIRVPKQDIARKLLQMTGLPLAAPSANASGAVSPTLAAHVIDSLGEETYVLDGGPCEVGIESTVVDVSGPQSSILRPGMIDETQISRLIGPLVAPTEEHDQQAPRPSPGMMERHYAPRARVHLFSSLTDAHFHAVLLGAGRKIGVLAFSSLRLKAAREFLLPMDPQLYAQQLYSRMRQLDEQGVELLLIEQVPQLPAWSGLQDRLRRAAQTPFP